jgi:uncharacterized protein GlcG (DUF336 family)
MLSLNEARGIIRAAENEAARLGCAVNIAVLDRGGHAIAHVRMDGAWLAGVDEAINKAYTACAFGIATKDLAGAVWAAGGRAEDSLGNDGRIAVGAAAFRSGVMAGSLARLG